MLRDRMTTWAAVFTIGLFALPVVTDGISAPRARAKPAKEIPLTEMSATFKQDSISYVYTSLDEGPRSLKRRAINTGPSNLFLVRGTVIATAIRSTEQAYMGIGVDRPLVGSPATRDKAVWVVAHLGVTASSPPAFEVKRVEQAGTRVRVSFERKQSFSLDNHPYLVWAPLGELSPGEYTLELFDAGRDRVVLTRLVEVDK